MMASAQDQKCDRKVKFEDSSSADSEQGIQGGGPCQNTVRVNNPQQTVIAHDMVVNGDVAFASDDRETSSQPESASYQSFHASNLSVNGGVSYSTHHHYSESWNRLEIPRWLSSLSPLSFDRKHRDTIEIFRKTPETGRWLLEEPRFLEWKDGKKKRILCSGIPGAGKTVLASIVINHLQTEIGRDACIFVYFDNKDHASYTMRNLHMNLLSQLLKYRTHFSRETEEAYQNFTQKSMPPSFVEITEMLLAEITTFSRVYIVIDALDECAPDPVRAEFLSSIRQLPDKVSTLFTSRLNMDFVGEVGADAEIPIKAQDEDLRNYLDGRLHDPTMAKFQALVQQGTGHFWEKARQRIIKKSDGMFLLARLHMDHLVCTFTVPDFKESIRTLPQTPHGVYQSTMDRIAQQPEFKQNLAILSLGWLIHAKRPLTITELLEAVAVEPTAKNHASLRVVAPEMLMSVCAGIIVVDAGTKIVRLAHYTASKYLETKEAARFRDFQSVMAKACLTYLLLDDFATPAQQQCQMSTQGAGNNRIGKERRKKYPFLNYAATHWGDHVAAGVEGPVHKLACELLTGDEAKRFNAYKAMKSDVSRQMLAPGVTGLHVAAYFGAKNLAQRLLSKRLVAPNAITTADGETALHWATYYKQTAVIEYLVSEGADVNIVDKAKRTALHRAIVNSDQAAVRTLFKAKTTLCLDGTDSRKWTPLRYAAAYGMRSLVDALLDHGAQIDAEDSDGWTALRWAANRGHRTIVENLIRRGASLQSPKNDKGWTLLLWAAREGRDQLIQLLAEKNKEVDLDALTDGETALHGAVRYGRDMAAYVLLQAGANVNARDAKGNAPLHAAVESYGDEKQRKKPTGTATGATKRNDSTAVPTANGAQSMPWLLLSSGADINAQTKLGFTALHIAAARGHRILAWLLLVKGADPSVVDNTGKTALHSAIAADDPNDEMIDQLLRHDASLAQKQDSELRTALHDAASAGHLTTVDLLLKNGSDVDAVDRQKCTALHLAVVQGHRDVARYLIENGASLKVRNRKKKTALDEAKEAGNENITELFRRSRGAAKKDGKPSNSGHHGIIEEHRA